jgi:hypothetical protein
VIAGSSFFKKEITMKKVIDGKLYVTEKATRIWNHDNGFDSGNFKWCDESLYRARSGAFFLAGSGGPMTRYGSDHGSMRGFGERIIPMTMDEAREWLEMVGADVDVITSLFEIIEA